MTRTVFQKTGRRRPVHPPADTKPCQALRPCPYDLKCFTPIEDSGSTQRTFFGWQLNCSGLRQLRCCWAELSALGNRFAPTKLSTILAQRCWKMEQEGEVPGGYSIPQPQRISGCRTVEKHPIYLNEPVDRGEASWNLMWACSCHHHGGRVRPHPAPIRQALLHRWTLRLRSHRKCCQNVLNSCSIQLQLPRSCGKGEARQALIAQVKHRWMLLSTGRCTRCLGKQRGRTSGRELGLVSVSAGCLPACAAASRSFSLNLGQQGLARMGLK